MRSNTSVSKYICLCSDHAFKKKRIKKDGLEWIVRASLLMPLPSFFCACPGLYIMSKKNWDVLRFPSFVCSYVPFGYEMQAIIFGCVSSIDWYLVLLFATQLLVNTNAISMWFRFQNKWYAGGNE